jgi:hypothetical protein
MFKTPKLSSFQHETIAARVRALDTHQSGFADAWEVLRTRLLETAGEDVAVEKEDIASVRELLERGVMLVPRSVIVPSERVRSLQEGSLTQWMQSRGTEPVSVGYALFGDGLWRQHTWLRSGDRVLDLGGAHLAYFGVELSLRETVEMFVAVVNAQDLTADPDARAFLEGVIDSLRA